MVKPGDVCQLTFDEEDYPEKEIPWGNPNLVLGSLSRSTLSYCEQARGG